MDELLVQYAPLVHRLALQLVAKLPANVEMDDLVQAGMMGLADALQRFDAAQGVLLETFASKRIRGAMLDELRAQDWLGRGTRRERRSVEAAVHRLQQRLGRTPRDGEIAHELGLCLADFQALQTNVQGARLVHLEDLYGGGSGEGNTEDDFLARHVPEQDNNPAPQLQEQRMREALVQAIKNLPPREQFVMQYRYERDLQWKDIGALLGVSESRAVQIHGAAIERLRRRLWAWR